MMVLKNSCFLCLLIICFSCSIDKKDDQGTIKSDTIIHHADFPSSYVTKRGVDVWLPKNYDPLEKYAVLYMHDGRMLFDSTTTWNKQEWGVDETMNQLLEGDKIRPCIVVAISNSGPGRHADYFPQKPFESLAQDFKDSLLQEVRKSQDQPLFATNVQSDGYLKFIVSELKPFIDSTYSTLTKPSDTFIAGSSMGGLISMYAICEYPEVFGGAACLSTHWPGIFRTENNPIPDAFISYLDHNLPSSNNHKLYFDYGTETLDAMYEPFQLMADSVLRKNGYDSSNWKTLKFEGANHSENAWKERLHLPLEFLLKP